MDAAALFLLMWLPFHWLVWRHFERLIDPAYLRQHGVVLQSERALEARSHVIGEYMGRPVWATVTFMGLVYRFDRVTGSGQRERTGPGELFLEPGLVYLTD